MAYQKQNLCVFSVFQSVEGAFGAAFGNTPKIKNGALRDKLKNGRGRGWAVPYLKKRWLVVAGMLREKAQNRPGHESASESKSSVGLGVFHPKFAKKPRTEGGDNVRGSVDQRFGAGLPFRGVRLKHFVMLANSRKSATKKEHKVSESRDLPVG